MIGLSDVLLLPGQRVGAAAVHFDGEHRVGRQLQIGFQVDWVWVEKEVEFTNDRMFEWSNDQMFEWSNVWMIECSNDQMF